MKVHSIFKDNLTFLLVKTGTQIRRPFAEYMETLDLVPPHKGVLTFLKEEGESNQLRLSEVMGVSKATMVRFLDHLQDKQLVSRVESKVDRREKVVKITSKGKKVLAQIEEKNIELEKMATKNISKSELLELKRILLKFHESID